MRDPVKTIRQAGAIVFRNDGSRKQVCLVRAKKNPAHWIFPKGHIEPGETAKAAAVRECLEEAGIVAAPVRRAGSGVFMRDGKKYRVAYYLLRRCADAGPGEPGRFPLWCTVEEALELLTFPDARDLLRCSVPHLTRRR